MSDRHTGRSKQLMTNVTSVKAPPCHRAAHFRSGRLTTIPERYMPVHATI
jgi:hypothetical protein